MLKQGSYRHVRFVSDAEGNVTSIQVGDYLDENDEIKDPREFTPYLYGGSSFTEAYFFNSMHVLYLTEESIVSYTLDTEYRVKSLNYVIGKRGKNAGKWRKEIQAYRDLRDEKIAADREALRQAELESREKYGLEGKSIKSINIVQVNDASSGTVRAGTSVQVGMEVTFEDGTIDKTHNLGGNLYPEDFETTFESSYNIGSEYSTGQWGEHCHCKEVSVAVPFGVKPGERDVLKGSISSKYHNGIEAEVEWIIDYGATASYQMGGMSGSYGSKGYGGGHGSDGGDGGDGPELHVYVTSITHSETGEALYYCRLGDTYKKVKENSTLHVSSVGGNGGTGGDGSDAHDDDNGNAGDGGNGGNGGNGGRIILHKDPSVKNLEFDPNVSGGYGAYPGSGGKCWNCDWYSDGRTGTMGSNGSSGSSTTRIEKVTF